MMSLSRRKFIGGASIIAIAAAQPRLVDAGINNPGVAAVVPAGPLGKSVLNIPHTNDLIFKNLVLNTNWQTAPGGYANVDGYVPGNSFTSSAGLVTLPSNYFGPYRISWLGSARIDGGGFPITVTTGGANFSSSRFNGTLPAAPNNYVEFTYSAPISNVTDSGLASSAGGNMILVTIAGQNSNTPNLCQVSGVVGVTAANANWTYLANQILTVGGTAQVGITLTLNIIPVTPAGGTLTTLTYVLSGGDTLQSAAAAMVALVNANAYLASNNVFAGAATAGAFDIYSPAAVITSSGGGTTTFVRSSSNARYLLVGSTFSGSYVSGGLFTLAPSAATFALINAGTFSSFSRLILCMSGTSPLGTSHVTDLADVLTGDLTKMFNQDFINLYAAMTPGILRFLDVAGINNGNQTRTGYLPSVNYIGYNSSRFPPNVWCGGNGVTLPNITSSGGGVLYACSAATDTPVGWTDGEVFQGLLDAVPTTTAITGASNNGSGIIRLRAANLTAFTTGQRVAVVGYNGVGGFAAGNGNGTWTITKGNDGADYIDLTSNKAGNPSVFTSAWTSGGSISAATINCGARGAKLLVGNVGAAPSGGNSFSTTQPITFIYNATLDAVVVFAVGGSSSSTGITAAWPLEVRVALCNKLNAHYWHQFPQSYDLASVTTETNYIKTNLNSTAACYPERGNEEWNSSFNTTGFSFNCGKCFDASNSTPFGGIDWVALQHRRFMGAVTTAWGARAGLNRVLPWQAANPAAVQSLLYNGGNLNGMTYPLYLAYVGGVDPGYNSAPNRPIDFADAISYAPYYSGGVISPHAFANNGSSLIVNALDIAGCTAAADNFATGTAPNIASAFAWCDNDIRQGTTSTQTVSLGGGTTFTVGSITGITTNTPLAFSLAVGGAFYSAGLNISAAYWPVNIVGSTFQLSLTKNGSAITGITAGSPSGVQIGLLGQATSLYEATVTDGYYQPYATFAASYSPPKKIVCYEDGFQGGPAIPVAGFGTTAAGIAAKYGGVDTGTVGYGGTIYDMLLAYKSSAQFKATVLKHWTDQQALTPGAGMFWPAWYTSSGSTMAPINTTAGCVLSANYPWAMMPTDLYGTPQMFKSYDAMQQFNNT